MKNRLRIGILLTAVLALTCLLVVSLPFHTTARAQEASSGAPVVIDSTISACIDICGPTTTCKTPCMKGGTQITCGQFGNCFPCSKCTDSSACTKQCLTSTGGLNTCGAVHQPCGVSPTPTPGPTPTPTPTCTKPAFSASATRAGINQNVDFTPDTSTIFQNSTVRWNFGDGTVLSAAWNQTVSHHWTATGNYNVVLTAADKCNVTRTSDPVTITVGQVFCEVDCKPL